jgi:TolB-like protein/tetratricopeptide (TPR) repeat protein
MLAVSLLLILAVLPTRWSKVRSAFIPNRHLSVSVLPFADLDDMPNDRYLGQGLSEELAAELGELPALKVVASGPRFQTGDGDVRALAHELNVGSILKGSVRRSGSQYRIAVQLIDGNDGRELWSNIFSGTVSDLPIMEEQVVRHTAQVLRVPVVAELQQTLARRAGENPETHEAYLQARYYWTKRDQASMRTSLELFQQAIAQDQNYALAYAGLADWYAVNAGTESMPVRVALPRARLFAKKAMDLDPTLAEPHAALGLLKCFAEWDWQGAREEFNRALALNPGYGTAHHWAGLNLIAMGKFEEADAELRKAAELDPLSPMISEGRAENFYYWHRFDDAIQVLQGLRSREQDPKAFLWPLAGALAAAGRYQEAYDNFQKAGPDGSPDVFALAEARLKILIGDRRDARVTLKKIEAKFRPGDPNPSYIASVHLALGEPDQAMIWLRRAYEQRDPMMVGIRWQPEMDSLKSDPRFLQLVHEVETAHDKSGGT